MTEESRTAFLQGIADLTHPINGQYPRPWMTRAAHPEACDVFIVGKNQRNGYPSGAIRHERHIDGLLNRNGESCRGIYDEMTAGRASPTRKNTDRFVDQLASAGITGVLETNVICYSSPMSADLRLSEHAGGSARGEELFRFLLDYINPRVLIVHGTGAKKKLSSVLRHELGHEPSREDSPSHTDVGGMHVFLIPSLAPPAWNRWCGWAEEHLRAVAREAKTLLG